MTKKTQPIDMSAFASTTDASAITDEEYKFLEVIYRRESIPRQAYLNFLNGSLRDKDDKDAYIDSLVSKFRESGLIDSSSLGLYRITNAGREKFEERSEKKSGNVRRLRAAHEKRFRPGSRFWLTLILLIVAISVATSIVLNHWDQVYQELTKHF